MHGQRSTIVVIAAGEADPSMLQRLPAAAPVVAADGGVDVALALGLEITVAVGDFDSVTSSGLATIERTGAQILRHSEAKDATDLELALDVAVKLGAERIVVVGDPGGRLDHLLAGLLLLGHERYAGVEIDALIGGAASVHIVRVERVLEGEPGELISLLPLHGAAERVTTDGLAYPLRGETLEPGSSRGVLERLHGAPSTHRRRPRSAGSASPRSHREETVVRFAVALIAAVCMLAGAAYGSGSSSRSKSVVLVTHESFAISKSVRAAFARQTGLELRILQTGDAGAALNRALLTAGKPEGDVFFGVDNNLLTRALAGNLFVPYRPAALPSLDQRYDLDATHRLIPVDHGEVCLNYDKAWFTHHAIAPPRSLDALGRPLYRGLLVVENPATSTPGLAFLLATIARYGENGWRAYWRELRTNKVLVTDGWEDAYEQRFSGAAGSKGNRPIVVSYASSPPAEVFFSGKKLTQAPTGVVLSSCFRQIEFAGVLRGARNPEGARQLIDFFLSPAFRPTCPCRCSSSRCAGESHCPRCSRGSRQRCHTRSTCRPRPSGRTATAGSASGRTRSSVDRRFVTATQVFILKRVLRHKASRGTRCATGVAAAIPVAFLGAVLLLPARIDPGARTHAGPRSGLSSDVLFSRETVQIAWFTVWQAAASTVLTLLAGMPLAWATAACASADVVSPAR